MLQWTFSRHKGALAGIAALTVQGAPIKGTTVLRARLSVMLDTVQASGVAEELLKTEFDAAHIIYNRFKSAIAYKPTLNTVLSPDVSAWQYSVCPSIAASRVWLPMLMLVLAVLG